MPLTEAKRNFRSKIVLAIVGAVILTWAGVVGYHRYQQWRLDRLISSSRRFLKEKDFRSAALTAQAAVSASPNHLEAATLLADILDQAQAIEAVSWRRRAADLSPNSSTNAFLWASTALRFGDLIGAEQALAKIPQRDRQTVAFHQLSAGLAIATKQFDLAELHFAAALEKDPTNQVQQLNLAIIQLQSPDAARSKRGRETLEALSADPKHQLTAMRALLTTAMAHQDRTAARELASKLAAAQGALFRDRVLALEAFRQTAAPDFPGRLQELQLLAAARPEAVFELMSWMNQHELSKEALGWMATLPLETTRQLPVPMAVAEALGRQRDWPKLSVYLGHGSWGLMEFMRAAWRARVDREQEQIRDYRARWSEAVRSAGGDPGFLWVLAQTASGWEWENEAEELWWMIGNGRTGQRPALYALWRLYYQRKETGKLLKVAERLYAVDPENPIAKNNVASLSLLLNKNQPLADQWAEENHRAYPASAPFATTLAYSLIRKGKAAEALDLLRKFPETAYSSGGMALYFALVLQANGEKEKALDYFRRAGKSGKLLPEEEVLLPASDRGA